jgi:negative regulator of flagellin synthesis FlgM
MTIDRISSLEPIQPGKKPGRTNEVRTAPQTDSISISSEAIEKAEILRAMDIVAASPEIREDRVAELKAKINDPTYINDKVLNATAERLIDALFS